MPQNKTTKKEEEHRKLKLEQLESKERVAFGEMTGALAVFGLGIAITLSIYFKTFIVVKAVVLLITTFLLFLLLGWVGGTVVEYYKARKVLKEFEDQ